MGYEIRVQTGLRAEYGVRIWPWKMAFDPIPESHFHGTANGFRAESDLPNPILGSAKMGSAP